MLFVTGDIHADLDIGKLSAKAFPQQKRLTKEDYVLICGDFGLVWDQSSRERHWQKWLSSKPFTTLWIDGNHENFDLLNAIPTVPKFGGRVREIAPNIYHLPRGQVLTINGKKLFVMGGAASHDKSSRTEHVSWWQEEMPSRQEMEQAVNGLEAADWSVDYVFTHCAPRSVQSQIAFWYANDPLTGFLERVCSELSFRHWYFGHYHIDKPLSTQFTAVYDAILPVFP